MSAMLMRMMGGLEKCSIFQIIYH